MRKQQLTFGVIVGSRGFFSPELARQGRAQLLAQLESLGHQTVILPAEATPTGAIETTADARKCADLFTQRRNEIDGVIISLPNFGDELGVVNTLHFARLGVPVLVQACDDELDKLDTLHRRDSFCGKLSVCNNLYQYGIPFTDTGTHTVALDSPAFTRDLEFFAGVCRVVGSLRSARIGAIGARPAAFQTVRASEKLLQASGITVIPVDLSEIIGAAAKIDTATARAKQKLEELRSYGNVPEGIPQLDVKFDRNLRIYLAVEDWMRENLIDAAGFQCWTSVQQNFGCATCLTMSMMGENLIPCACEVDVVGAASMFVLMQASGNPSALIDWNNNYGSDLNKCVAQHCSNYPKSFLGMQVEVSTLDVLGNALGADLCFGAVKGKADPGPMTYLRISTDDRYGLIKGFLGEGEFTADPFNMSGGIAVCQIPNLQKLLKFMCKNGFEHHGAMVRSHCARIIEEALTTYMNWNIHLHE
jgi:L-fucose isomerase-like protein